MDERHADDSLDAYALGALEPEEAAWVEAHLAQCARCRQLAADARAVANRLPLSVPLVVPPPDLRARVLARVHAVAQADAAAHNPPAATPAPAAEQAPAAPTPETAAPAGGLLGRIFRGRGAGDREARAAAERLALLLATPGAAVWEVPGTAEAPAARARLVGVPDGHEGVLLTVGLRGLPTGSAYQVWFLRGGQPLPNATFRVGHDGVARQIVHTPGPLRDYDVVAITPEPAGGSPAPTGPIVLAGQLGAPGAS
ncbi:MAG TPA: anti-sigma factor [Ktedonobacterales bacterium]|nr:anti-sigma factor [Ktedonobacterales bacterium]